MSFEQPSLNPHFEPIFFPGTQEVAAAIVDNAFPQKFPTAIIDHSRKNRDFFEPSVILDGKVTDQRRSQTCAPIEDLKSSLQRAISERFADICAALSIEPFQLLYIEAQLTFHQNGDFFRAHRDNRGLITRSRLVSYVYYFRTDAASFTGGQLRMHKTDDPTAREPDAGGVYIDVEPAHNRIVFFLSDNLHEVLEIHSEGADFLDGRGSIVGWLRTADISRVRLMPGERDLKALAG